MQLRATRIRAVSNGGGSRFPSTGPTLDLNFVDQSEPTLSLDFTNEQYAVYVPDSTNTPVGTYRIWS